jgi:hypothetical protein
MNLHHLTYGNPAAYLLPFIESHSFLDCLFTECTAIHFPANDSDEVKGELNQLVELSEQLKTNPATQERYKTYDQSLYNYLTAFNFNDPEENGRFAAIVKNVYEDVQPMIYKLKIHFQRPRPFQLAGAHRLKLFPQFSYSADCPAYPSLHASIAYVLCEVCGNHYPTQYKYFIDLAKDIACSRLYMGLNYASDIQAAKKISDKILANKEFILKYGL